MSTMLLGIFINSQKLKIFSKKFVKEMIWNTKHINRDSLLQHLIVREA